MRAPQVGVIQDDDVPGPQGVGEDLQRGPHRRRHGPQVHRHVGGLRYHVALGIKDGAGEIAPLLDVRRVSGPLQGDPHLLGDRFEHVFEYFQAYWIHGHGSTSRAGYGDWLSGNSAIRSRMGTPRTGTIWKYSVDIISSRTSSDSRANGPSSPICVRWQRRDSFLTAT